MWQSLLAFEAGHTSDWRIRDLLKPNGGIDVFDFFSGCGGMSAGFVAVNSAVPAYRLAMAVDLDEDANTTYCTNLGLKPKKIDIARLAEDCSAAKKLIDDARQSLSAPFVMIGCAPCQGFSSHRNAVRAFNPIVIWCWVICRGLLEHALIKRSVSVCCRLDNGNKSRCGRQLCQGLRRVCRR
ncbi:DNA cytosine methyltransferase [Rhizobium mongolense]|uniref:DNA cytosine methyltransferase n=1 Tax=Rhizobium mongolense TaxID=57676 RepID=UPI0035563F52